MLKLRCAVRSLRTMKFFLLTRFALTLGFSAGRRVRRTRAGDFLKARQAVSARLLPARQLARRPASAGRVCRAGAGNGGDCQRHRVGGRRPDGAAVPVRAGASVALSIPPGLRGAAWLDSGAQVRVLLAAVA